VIKIKTTLDVSEGGDVLQVEMQPQVARYKKRRTLERLE
jgi:hypothetical protein